MKPLLCTLQSLCATFLSECRTLSRGLMAFRLAFQVASLSEDLYVTAGTPTDDNDLTCALYYIKMTAIHLPPIRDWPGVHTNYYIQHLPALFSASSNEDIIRAFDIETVWGRIPTYLSFLSVIGKCAHGRPLAFLQPCISSWLPATSRIACILDCTRSWLCLSPGSTTAEARLNPGRQ